MVHPVRASLSHRRGPGPASASTSDRHRRERGISVLLVALLLIPLLIVTAIVVDIGYAKQRRRQVQSGADAAALAAAQELDGTSTQVARAVSAAKTWAAKNVDGLVASDWIGCSDPGALAARPDAGNTCISFDSTSAPTRVRVRIPAEDQPQFFGQMASSDALSVTAHAVAARAPGVAPSTPAGPCGLCVIGDRTLQIAGTTQIQVTGGEIQADRLTANANDSNTAITPTPLKWYSANGSNWGRNVQPSPATFNSRYVRLTAPVPNPFDGVTVSYTGLTVSDANVNLPGQGQILPNTIYRQNVSITSGTVTLQPNSTYYFANTLIVNSGAKLVGNGVTLVFGCTSPCNGEGGKFNFNQGSTVEITAPTTGPYAGFAILFDPGNRSGTPNQLSGTITLAGAVYAKGAGFNMGSSSAVVKAWTVVSGGNFDANNGRIEIDNTKYATTVGGGGGGGSTAGGQISLVG